MGFFDHILPAVTGAVGAITGIGEGIWNANQQSKINQQNLDWSKEQFDKTRQYALQDWDKQNAYNAPSAQMARYKAAGLNPHLIYGQSNTSAPIRSVEPQQPKLQAPQLHVADALSNGSLQMYNLQQTIAQTDLIKAQAALARQNKLLAASRGDNVAAGTQGILQKNLLGKNLMESQFSFAKQHAENEGKKGLLLDRQNTKLQADTAFTLHQDARNGLLTGASLRDTASRILRRSIENATSGVQKMVLTQQLENLKTDNQIKYFDAQIQAEKARLSKQGMTQNDPFLLRLYEKSLDSILGNN